MPVVVGCSHFDLCQVVIDTQGRVGVEAPSFQSDFARLYEVWSCSFVGFELLSH